MPINECQYKRCDVKFKTLHSGTKYCCKKCRRLAIREGRMFYYYGIKFWLITTSPVIVLWVAERPLSQLNQLPRS